ncbi:type VI secretion system membrane subunit TssM [Novosphingobium sp. KACC 22771]|uniref:type VI secretion system membrane subunit TssM n=1 Tax=Novosphingobium sp. KACC 22771 TaxID=3025670 RepID=UPI002365945D|nr:type VI secretion system membrane subunit TssM [Novosphingobium sp. KACC 22771]WDF73061.1 type VI secretion system membrane subunit TssM [Novosphingobium sp. KACC 22771]
MKAMLRNLWFWRVVGALALGLLIWFVGPLIAIGGWRPFGWWVVTLVFALLPIIVVGALWALAGRREKAKNAQMMEALKPDPGAADRSEISAKLSEALDMLKATRVGSRQAYAYQLPWYAIIGPSGAGKTTALLNCGLEFPTAVAGEYRALRGQPKTPNCDWWFTDEAVLIDTAGRYVTQDDDASEDAAGWKSFLELLQQYRPLQPLNGVIVAIPAPDFVDAAKMTEHARHIRARLAEIGKELGQNLPVYVLITKADLLAGFREYFRTSTDSEAEQVFGATATSDTPDSASVLAGFKGLVTSIASRVVERMQNEPQMHLRAQIAAFPAQLASLEAPIARLLDSLGQKSRFDEPARVRGVYLASSVQSGNPIDRILLSVGAPATHSAYSVGTGRSYFLKRFFSDLLIPEQGMAGRNPLAEKKAARRYTLSVAAAVAALVVCCGVWTWGYFRNLALIDGVIATAGAYGNVRASGTGVDQDIAALGVLGDAVARLESASDFGLGLGQGGRLSSELGGIYGRDLQRRLTPLLVGLAEQRMASDNANPSALYDDLKAYLILGGQGPAQGEHVVAWVQPAWIARAGSGGESQAGELMRHTKALFDRKFAPHAIDAGRVEAVRTVLRAQPAAVRVYGRLKSQANADGAGMWSARENAGPRPEVFFDMSGAFATGAGVPTLFTRAGYDKVFLPIVAKGGSLLEEEKWVVGDAGSRSLSPAELASLHSDLEKLYFAEFLDRWQSYLGTIKPRPVNGLGDNVQRLRDGGGPLSPIKPLLVAIAKATDMSGGVAAAAGGRLAQAAAGLGGGAGAVALGGASGMGNGSGRQAVIDAFTPLRMFVGKGEGAPVDAWLQGMGQLADKLNVIAVLPGGGGETGSQQSMEAKAAILQLDQTGNSMPAPAGLWAKAVASDANVSLGGARLAQMGAAMSGSFGETCATGLVRSYPVSPGSSIDLAVADFTRFFSPQGLFANFVNTQLGGYLDKTPPTWTPKSNASEIGLTQATVSAMQAADTIARTFFGSDPTMPHLSYQIEPVALSGADSVTLQIDGQTLRYDGKVAVPTSFDWPGGGGASASFATPGGAPAQRTWNGPWAAFRLFKVAAIKAGASPAIGEGSLAQGGARFDFRVRTMNGSNPFVLDPFVKVRCPTTATGPAQPGLPG